MLREIISLVRDIYRTQGPVPLHAPSLGNRERALVNDALDSTFVSSVGPYVDRFEALVAQYTGSERAVATVNGTAALHVALRMAGVQQGDLVMTQPLTFVATCNAIRYCGADPVFIDVALDTLGMCPDALRAWLEAEAAVGDDGVCRHRATGRAIRACLPMHTFGHPADIDGLSQVCAAWGLALIEDAAESLGSLYKGRHTGTFGLLGTLSFNGNKIVTTGGGGMLLASAGLGDRARHLTTTAKAPHAFEYVHDEVGYNYRLPNINAALGCAQMENIDRFISAKRALAGRYASFFENSDYQFVSEPAGCRSNYWLNAVVCKDLGHRDALLRGTNEAKVMTRPIWRLMPHLPMYADALRGALDRSLWLEQRVVNLPSSVPPG
ncbi:MAG TPA: LegC family aminotransferase [Frateuria sp.]|uniref:LegC family aminotransferase n=1 Tax=Frateuria sp. TaxID=2211372 RepID=UPI002D7F86B2|nr:LegC family aminotransferase [Frateuria sp.]HET6804140.1 LegC family aminotransferase [Frateuria sp.]